MSVLDNVMTGFHSVSKNGMLNIIYNPRGTRREEAANREKAMEILHFLKLEHIRIPGPAIFPTVPSASWRSVVPWPPVPNFCCWMNLPPV